MVKFGFSEKATKFEKNLRRTFDKSFVFCARNSVLVKNSTKISSKQMWSSCITQTLQSSFVKEVFEIQRVQLLYLRYFDVN